MIDVKITSLEQEEITYPCIGYDELSESCVLLQKYGVGTVLIQGSSRHKVGTFYNGWDMELLKRYEANVSVELLRVEL